MTKKKRKQKSKDCWTTYQKVMFAIVVATVFINSLCIAINSAQIFIMKHGNEIPDSIYTNIYTNYLNNKINEVNSTELEFYKNYTLPLINANCTDDYCKAKEVIIYLDENFQYEVGEDLNPRHIINESKGDCDEMTWLYMNLLKSINVSSTAECTLTHCWSVVHLPDGKNVTADITGHRWEWEQ